MTSFISALIITLIVEVAVAFFLGYKKQEAMIAIASINILTNPIFNLAVLVNSVTLEINFYLFVFILEILVIIAEWRLLNYLLKQTFPKRNFLLDSIVLNVTSYLIGYLIFSIF